MAKLALDPASITSGLEDKPVNQSPTITSGMDDLAVTAPTPFETFAMDTAEKFLRPPGGITAGMKDLPVTPPPAEAPGHRFTPGGLSIVPPKRRTASEMLGGIDALDVITHLPGAGLVGLNNIRKKIYETTKAALKSGDIGPNSRFGMTPMGGFARVRAPQTREQANALVREYEAQQARGDEIPAAIIAGIGDLPGFMAEMAAGGIGKVRSVPAAFMFAGKILPIQFGRIEDALADQIDRGETGYTAVAKSIGDVYIESLSETAGPGLAKVASKMPFFGKLTGAMRKYAKGKLGWSDSKFWDEIGTKVGYNGFIEQWGEERLNSAMKAIVDVDDFGAGKDSGPAERLLAAAAHDLDFTNAETRRRGIIEAGILAAPGALRTTARTIAGREPEIPETTVPPTPEEQAAGAREIRGALREEAKPLIAEAEAEQDRLEAAADQTDAELIAHLDSIQEEITEGQIAPEGRTAAEPTQRPPVPEIIEQEPTAPAAEGVKAETLFVQVGQGQSEFIDGKNDVFDAILGHADSRGWKVEQIDTGGEGAVSKYVTLRAGEKTIRVRVSDHDIPAGLRDQDHPNVNYVLHRGKNKIRLGRLDKFLPNLRKAPFTEGDRIKHDTFGEGKIVEWTDAGKRSVARVEFDSGEVKNIMPEFSAVPVMVKLPAQPAPAAEVAKAEKQAWEMTRDEFRDEDKQYQNAIVARDKAQAAISGAQRHGETRRFAGAAAGNRLDKLDKARERVSKQFDAADRRQEAAVKQAVQENLPVPRPVLEEYKGAKWADEALAKAKPARGIPESAKSETQKLIEAEAAEEEKLGGMQDAVHTADITDTAERTEEELTGLSSARRTRIKRETAANILEHDIYQAALEAQDVRESEVDVGFYFVDKSGFEEIEQVIQSVPKGRFRNRLRKMFTFDKSDDAISWDVAVQEGMGRGKEGVAETEGHLDLTEFAERVKEALMGKKTEPGSKRLNSQAMDTAAEAGEPFIEMMVNKFRMLQHGATKGEINRMILDVADHYNLAPEAVIVDMIDGDQVTRLESLTDAEADAEIERLAEQEVEAEDLSDAEGTAKDVLEKNGVDVHIEVVEEITPEELKKQELDLFDDIPFEMRGKPTGATLTQSDQQVILLAYGADSQTGYHEGYHVLRPRLTAQDGRILTREFENEEAEAAAFGQFAQDQATQTGMVRSIFQKLMRILRRIRSALVGAGFRTHEQIFKEITTGQIRKVSPVLGNARASFELKEPSAIFYSKLKRAVEAKMPNKIPAEQFARMLKKEGIKADETKWTGIDDLIAKGGIITKAEVLETLAVNDVKIEEVIKGGQTKRAGELHDIQVKRNAVIEQIDREHNDIRAAIDKLTEEQKPADNLAFKAAIGGGRSIADQAKAVERLERLFLRDFQHLLELRKQKDELNRQRDAIFAEGEDPDRTFFNRPDLVIPGGTNYREVLLTLPFKKLPEGIRVQGFKLDPSNKWVEVPDEEATHFWAVDPDGSQLTQAHVRREDAAGQAIDRFNREQTRPERRFREEATFISPHFPEKNILTHIRLTDRVNTEGKKVLFVEEIQSDWLQTGREKGFKGDKQEIPEGFEVVEKTEDGRTVFALRATETTVFQKEGEISAFFPFLEDAIDIVTGRPISDTVGQVPDAPFKKTWHELAFKRVLRFAAEGGYDVVAWTTGEQQADRFDLSKQVDAVRLEGDFEQSIEVMVARPGQGFEHLQSTTKDKLADFVGKDIAAKAIEKGQREFRGLDLKVGGEGMKAFYDRFIPNFARKYLKKWDGKVGTTELKMTKPEGVSDPVHAVDVTPAMVESVMAGQVQFESSRERLERETNKRARINAKKARMKAERKGKKVSRAPLRIKLKDTTPFLRPDLKPLELPPEKMVTPLPAERKGAAARHSEEGKILFRKRERKSLREIISEKAKAAQLEFDRIFESMSARLERIHPLLMSMVRRYVFDIDTRTTLLLEETAPFIKGIKKIKGDDARDLKYALNNNWRALVEKLVAKYGLEEEYLALRSVLDAIHKAGNEVGLEILYRGDHFPRRVKDLKGLLKFLDSSDKHSAFAEAIRKRTEQAGGRQLTDQEKTQVINTLLRGFRVGGVSLSRPGVVKDRSIEEFDRSIEKYYFELDESLEMYVQDMVRSITTREFFGKQTAKIAKLRAQESRLRTRLHKLQTRTGLTRPVTLERHKTHISTAAERLKEIHQELEDHKGQDLEDTIGFFTAQLGLDSEQQDQVGDMLKAIMEPKGLHGGYRTGVKLAYLDVLANIPVAMTQLEEIGLSVYRDNLRAIPAAHKALLKKSGLKLKDIGIDDINQYMRDLGLEGWMDKAIFAMRAVDKFGKQTLLNTELARATRLARNSPNNAKFISEMRRVFGDEFRDVINDLAAGRITDNVKFLMFSKILDLQPSAITETPEYYAIGGNWRILYMLRQFTLKRMSVMRDKAVKAMTGTPADRLAALADLANMLAILTAFGVGKDFIKDWYLGKDFDLWDSVLDNMLQFMFLSRWRVQSLERKDPSQIIGEELGPPAKAIDAIWRDVRKGEINKSVRSIPIVGEEYYWWFGGGSEKGERNEFLDIYDPFN